MTDDRIVIIEGPDAMEHFKLCQVISRLRIETSTGLGFKQSTLAAVQKYYGIKARTKKAALAELENLYEERYGRRYGN